MTTWILVSNASQAQLYQTELSELHDKKAKPELLHTYQHPESREKDEDLVSDNLGRFHGKQEGRGNFIETTEPREHEADLFARELIEILEAGRNAHNYEHLIIAAPPHFHGLLNKHMNKNISRMITSHIEKDYTQDNMKDLLKHLEQYL